MNGIRYRTGRIARTAQNEMKMGAYYTDVSHCRDISKMFLFPEEEVCILEPSIGDASAVLALTAAERYSNRKIFGVELNPETAKNVQENPYVEECIEGDFLTGVRISRNAFSFCFCNPPYMNDDLDGNNKRMEMAFLEKITENYLIKGGILVLVVNRKMWGNRFFFRYLLNHYEFLAVYKFREEEYIKWNQVVFVGRKTASMFHSLTEIDEVKEKYMQLEELPEEFEETFQILPSCNEKVTCFCAKEFRVQDALASISFETNNPDTEVMDNLISRILTQKPYNTRHLGRPPIPLKKDSLYMAAMTGCGQGKSGTEGKDLHLQRGSAEIVEDIVYEEDKKNPDNMLMKVTSRTSISMRLIETNGKISVLE